MSAAQQPPQSPSTNAEATPLCVCVCSLYGVVLFVRTSYYALYHYIIRIDVFFSPIISFQLPYIVFHFCINVYSHADTMLTMEQCLP